MARLGSQRLLIVRLSLLLVPLIGPPVAAEPTRQEGWDGTMRDSAGIVLVEVHQTAPDRRRRGGLGVHVRTYLELRNLVGWPRGGG